MLLRLYLLLLSALGSFVLVRSSLDLPSPDLRELLLAALAVVAGLRSVQIPGTGARLNADTPFLLALVGGGAGHLAILAAAGGQVAAAVAAGRVHRVVFHAAAGASATAFAVVVGDA